jgi:nucleoside 2-deoxyribosyltransferase
MKPITKDPYTIYFAGPLFKQQELVGNTHTARYIEELSGGLYQCVLPQDLEQTHARTPISIRDQDLLQVMINDLGIFNFDGAPVDDGTVVEYITAKFLDIPSVLTRSDFRIAGDGEKGDPWNLMMSGWPRTKILNYNSMAWYQEEFKRVGTTRQGALDRYYSRIAAALIEQLDAVVQEHPVTSSVDDAVAFYEAARRSAGASFYALTAKLDLKALVTKKKSKGLL